MSDIFICYSRTDIAIATQLMQRLQAAGWDVFIDKKTHVGRRWHKEIERELHLAKAVVVLWSANSRNSDYVLEEAEFGKRKDILFPAFIEQVETPYGFSRIQTAHLIGWKGNPDHPGMIEILDALRLHLSSHTPSGFDIDANANAPEPVAQPIASSSVASELTDHDNLQTNAGTNNNQVQKKENNIVFVISVLGIVIFLVAAWAFDKFSKSDRLYEESIDETEPVSEIVEQAEPPKLSQTQVKDLVSNGLLPELILIPAGSFMMGEQDQEFIDALYDDRKKFYGIPGKRINIGKPFYLGKTEVTYRQYDYYIQEQKSEDQQIKIPETAEGGRENQPVVNINWFEAIAYSAWLDKQLDASCRLPNEAEWEYAARAKTQTAYPWGDDSGSNHASCIRCGSQWNGKQAAPVAQFNANKFGLYDMSGNVWEWTSSNWREQFDGSKEQESNEDTINTQSRVLRGGSWSSGPDYVRSSARYYSRPAHRSSFIGFRVLCLSPIE